MTIEALKKLRADLGYITSDPDSKLTTVQAFHLARATVAVRDAIAAAEAERRPIRRDDWRDPRRAT